MQGIAQDRHAVGEKAAKNLQHCKTQIQEKGYFEIADRAMVPMMMVCAVVVMGLRAGLIVVIVALVVMVVMRHVLKLAFFS